MYPDPLNVLKECVLEYLKDEKVDIILFGSRARRDHSAGSDADIGIIPRNDIDNRKIAALREFIDEKLNIPFHVDIVDFSTVSQQFKEEALKGALFWKELN